MTEYATESHSLRRLFRHSLDSHDPALLKTAFKRLRTVLQKKSMQDREVSALLKLLINKAVDDQHLELLKGVLEHKPLAMWVDRAVVEAKKHNWIDGCRELSLHTESAPVS